VGGGFLLVPLQVMWSGTRQRIASGTSLAAILPIATVGALAYYFGKGEPQVDLAVAFFLVLGSVFGAFGGAYASTLIPENALKIIVALMLLGVGVKEINDALFAVSTNLSGHYTEKLDIEQYLLMTLAGFAIGLLSGMTGIGGGILLVPTMVLGFGIAQRIAQGTSLLAILPTAAVGAFSHYRNGNVDLRTAASIAGAGAPSSVIGAGLALWLPDRILLGFFGLFLVFGAIRMWPRPGTSTGTIMR